MSWIATGAFVLSLAVSLLLQAPAGWLLAVLPGSALTLAGAGGSIVRGGASRLRAGPLDLGPVRWSLRAPSALAPCLSWDVVLERGRGRMSRCFPDRLLLTGLALEIPAQALPAAWLPAAWPPARTPSGTLALTVHRLSHREDRTEASGELVWRDAKLGAGRIDLGTVHVPWHALGPALDGRIASNGGEVTVTGQWDLVACRRYRADLRVAPIAHGDAGAREIGLHPGEAREYRLKLTGRLPRDDWPCPLGTGAVTDVAPASSREE